MFACGIENGCILSFFLSSLPVNLNFATYRKRGDLKSWKINFGSVKSLLQKMEITRELLEKYHGGNCTAGEKRAVENWLKQQSMETDFPAGMGDGKVLEDTIWNSMSKNLDFTENEKSESAPKEYSEKRMSRIGISFWFLRVAASVLVVAATGYALWFFSNREFSDKNNSEVTGKSMVTQYVTIRTRVGERKQYTLPDGSEVMLNAESEIRFPSLFLLTDTLRRVYLNGEAFFSVEKDQNRPFVVHTAHSQTRVLGTRFNLKAYEKERFTELVVEEGKVKFSDTNSKQHLILTASQRAVMDGSDLAIRENVYADRYFAWKENKLVFENQSLTSIAADLERWYGVEVTIENNRFKNNRYTGSFVARPISEVLETMGYAVGFKFAVTGKKVIIY